MLMALTVGFMSFEELSKWFGLSRIVTTNKIFTQKRVNDLSNYASYEIVPDGIKINYVIFPYYIKRNKTRDSIYIRYVNKILKKIEVMKKEEILDKIAELSTDEPVVAKEYGRQVLDEFFKQSYIFKVEPEDTQALEDMLKKEINFNTKGLSIKDYNKLLSSKYSKVRLDFAKRYGYAPQEVGVYYERVAIGGNV